MRFLTAALMFVAAPAMGATCESLSSFSQPHVAVTLAQPVTTGAFVVPGRGPRGVTSLGGLPPFCRVAATLTPSSDSDIKIEVWLPAQGWNGKLEAVGNGGWAGTIS